MRTAIALLMTLVIGHAAIGQTSLLERHGADLDVERQRTAALVNERLDETRRLMQAERFAQADMTLRNAERLVNSSRALPAQERQELMARISQVSTQVNTAYAAAQAESRQRARAEIEQQQRERIAGRERMRQEQLESQRARLRDYEQVNEYGRAAAVADSILRADPTDNRARRTRDKLDFYAEHKRQLELRTERMTLTKEALTDVEQAAVPREGLTYPSNWQTLTAKRHALLARESQARNRPAPVRQFMGTRVNLNMEGVTLDNIVAYLSDTTQVPIVFDPRIADDTGRDPRQEIISLNATGLTLRQALDMILPNEYGYRADEQRLIISSREKAYPLRVIIYPIQHLVAEIPDFGSSVPRFNPTNTLEGGSGASTGTSGQDIWTQSILTDETKEKPEEKLIQLVQRFVRGTSDYRIADWDIHGGQATIEYFDGNLIVNQTEEGHRQVIQMINQLR